VVAVPVKPGHATGKYEMNRLVLVVCGKWDRERLVPSFGF